MDEMTDEEYPIKDNHKAIIVVGVQRSGNTWITRLIAEYLDSPVKGFGGAMPIAIEGITRPGDWFITQLHAEPIFNPLYERAIRDRYTINLSNAAGCSIVHVVRDPRDVAVSCMHYFDLKTIKNTLDILYNCSTPINCGWNEFNRNWLDADEKFGFPVIRVRYEDFNINPPTILAKTLASVKVVSGSKFKSDHKRIANVVFNQQIDNKRAQVMREDEGWRSWNKGIQRDALRNGRVGEWREVFTDEDNKLAIQYFGEMMKRLGYSYE